MSARAILLSPAVVGAVSFVLGAAATFKIAQRKYADLADSEIREAKAYYQKLEKESEERLEESVKERAAVIIDTLGYAGEPAKVPTLDQMDESQRFLFLDTTWDFAAEVAKRSDDKPFIIHRDEFFGDEIDYVNASLVYYAADGVLADDKDQVIDDIVEYIGSHDNLRFGYGSQDDNIVYIRNHTLSLDMEILLNTGKYSVVVQGFEE